MFCKNCGNEIRPGEHFCLNCGTKAESFVESAPATPTNNTAAPQGVIYASQTNTTYTPVTNYENPPTGKNKSGSSHKALLIVSAVVIVLLIGVIVFLLLWNRDGSTGENQSDTVTTQGEGFQNSVKSGGDSDSSTSAGQDRTVTITGNSQAKSEYIIPDSDTRLITYADLEPLTEQELMIARNELYARHGRLFNDQTLQKHFDSCSWYRGTIAPDNFSETVFNSVELANKDTFVKFEIEKGYRKP